MMEYELTSHGETALEDIAMCKRINEVLQRAYAGYEWMVSVDHDYKVAQAVIELPWSAPAWGKNYGYVLNILDIDAPNGDDLIRTAGGELLERFGLPRSRAPIDAARRMMEQGIITDGAKKLRRSV